MNEAQKSMLLLRKEKLQKSLKKRKQEGYFGIILIIIGILFASSGGFMVLSVEFILGIVIAIWGFTQKSKKEKEIADIDFKLAEDKENKKK